jgi:hypothetical protein
MAKHRWKLRGRNFERGESKSLLDELFFGLPL